MSTLGVELKDLIPGKRYSFTSDVAPGRLYKGTFKQVIGPYGSRDRVSQYMFTQDNGALINFTNPDYYPRNISELPSQGGKSRKNKKSKKSYKKSKKTRKSRKYRR